MRNRIVDAGLQARLDQQVEGGLLRAVNHAVANAGIVVWMIIGFPNRALGEFFPAPPLLIQPGPRTETEVLVSFPELVPAPGEPFTQGSIEVLVGRRGR